MSQSSIQKQTDQPDVMRTAADFHRHDTRSLAVQKGQQPVSLESLGKHNPSGLGQILWAALSLARITPENLDFDQICAPLRSCARACSNSRSLAGSRFIALAG